MVQGGANRRDPAEIVHKFVAVDHAVIAHQRDLHGGCVEFMRIGHGGKSSGALA